jgi:hypothetical protein
MVFGISKFFGTLLVASILELNSGDLLTKYISLASFAGVVIAVSGVKIPHATKIYAGMIVVVAAVNRWVTNNYPKQWYVPLSQLVSHQLTYPSNPVKRLLLNILATIGIAELETIYDSVASGSEKEGPVALDVYQDRFVHAAKLSPPHV